MEWENRNRTVQEASSDAFLIGFGRLFKGQEASMAARGALLRQGKC